MAPPRLPPSRGAALLCAAAAAQGGPLARLKDGDAEGVTYGSVNVWRGIPFAAPPVGDLRWRPPQPPARWGPATLDASRFRDDCMQGIEFAIIGSRPMANTSEDCLYVNIFAPQKVTAPKPVMLWVYGGGFNGGGSSIATYNGATDVALLSGELVIVSFNYRVAVFGYAASDRLRPRDPAGGTGNYGILDQRLAMRWVKDNIAAVGGDPARVFVVGESAGADSVANHLVRKNSWGMFSGAGMESGAFYEFLYPGVGGAGGMGPTPGNVTVAEQEPAFDAMLKKAGCADVECLIKVPGRTLMKQQPWGQHPWIWVPAIDGVDLVEPAKTLAERGELAPVPILIGSNMEDATNAISDAKDSCTEADFRKWAMAAFGLNASAAARMSQVYADEASRPKTGTTGTKWYWASVHAGADSQMGSAARRLARWATKAGQRAYWFYFSHMPVQKSKASQATHGSEIPFLFHNGIDASEAEFSRKLASYWASFAAGGEPKGSVSWPAYDTEKEAALVFGGGSDDLQITAEEHFRGARLDFWDSHLREWGSRSK